MSLALETLAQRCWHQEDWQADIHSESFDADGVRLQLLLPEIRVAQAQARIIDISHGRSIAVRLD